MNLRPYTPATATSLIARALLDFKNHEKLTLAQMSKIIGLSKPALTRHIYGDAILKTREFKKLAKFFQWTSEEVGVAAMFKPTKKKKGRKK